MPTTGDFGGLTVDQGLSPSNGIQVKRINRSEHDSRFYLQLESEEMVDKFLQAVGEEGKQWKEESTGNIFKIKAKKEGDDWIKVKISNIDQDTDAEEVKKYFSHVGEVKDYELDEIDGVKLDTATIKVNLKEYSKNSKLIKNLLLNI